MEKNQQFQQIIPDLTKKLLLQHCVAAYGELGVTIEPEMANVVSGTAYLHAYGYIGAFPPVSQNTEAIAADAAWTLFLVIHKKIWQLGGWRAGSSWFRSDMAVEMDIDDETANTFTITVRALYLQTSDDDEERNGQRRRTSTSGDYVPPVMPAALIPKFL